MAGDQRRERGERPLIRIGRYAWAALGVALLVAVVGFVAGQISVVVVPVILALFPAALLLPVADWLCRHRVPGALASLITLLGALLVFSGIIGGLVPLVMQEVPQIAASLEEGIQDLDEYLRGAPLGIDVGGVEGLQERIGEFIAEDDNETATQAATAVGVAIEVVVGTVLLFVVLFFYLKDGRRIAAALGTLFPARYREDVAEMASRMWVTVGGFFRSQLLVALFDAVLIGVGLLVLRVPLAIPLAVLIFFGGMFPIIGAWVTGLLAVLVAFAHGGLGLAIAVMLLILAVQQLETNVLEPYIVGRIIHLHPLAVLTAVMAGAVSIGILGAFLAAPALAAGARAVDYLREKEAIAGA
jgi:putative heme transporter